MAAIHLIEGPVGAGKSTFAAKLGAERSIPRLNLDEWMVVLFRPDRPAEDFLQWYGECKQRCIEQIWRVASDLLDVGSDVILELGLVQAQDRSDFYSRIDGLDVELKVYVLDVPKAIRATRVKKRNTEQGSTYQMAVSDEIFEMANGAWQMPDAAEIAERDIQILSNA